MQDSVFSPSFGNKPRTLVGRDLELQTLKEGLHAMPGSKERAKLIIGQRGLGKTVLLLELADFARENGYIVSSPTVTSEDMLDRIMEKLNRSGEKVLPHSKPKLIGGSVSVLGFGAGIQTKTESDIERSFAYRLLEFCENAEKAGKGVLILVDEVHANSESLTKLIIAYQEMVGEGKNIAVVFAGLPAAVSKTLNQHVLTFFNRASKLFLEPIAIPAIAIYYRNSFDKIGIDLEDARIDHAAQETEGSPYLMQLIGHYLTLSASDDGVLMEKNYKRALELAKQEFISDICETTLAPLSARDIDFLRAMAQDDRESSVKAIAARLGVDASYTQRYKTRLSQAGIITQKRRGFVEFAVPYIRDYLRSEEE